MVLPDHQLLCLTMDLDQLGQLEVLEVQAMAMAAQDMVLDMVKVHLQPQAMVHLMSLAMVSNKVNLVTNSSIKVNLVSSNRLLFRCYLALMYFLPLCNWSLSGSAGTTSSNTITTNSVKVDSWEVLSIL